MWGLGGAGGVFGYFLGECLSSWSANFQEGSPKEILAQAEAGQSSGFCGARREA